MKRRCVYTTAVWVKFFDLYRPRFIPDYRQKPLHPSEKSEDLHQEMRFSWIEDMRKLKSAASTRKALLELGTNWQIRGIKL